MPPKGRVKGRIGFGKAPGVDLCWVDPRKEKERRARIDRVRPMAEKILSNPRKTNLVGANGHGIRKIPPPPANKAKK